MPSARDLTNCKRASIIAPAGHGKTELIAEIASLGSRCLVLTHTHAGVHAIRARLARRSVPHSAAAVDTIAGWCMRYAHAFPGKAKPPPDLPTSSAEWDQLYRGAMHALQIEAVGRVLRASYDRVLVDEYQDCNSLQHELVIQIASHCPTLVFGDPMQGIFEFAGAKLNWPKEVQPHFPTALNLETPFRWRDSNPALGEWIAETRQKLMTGQTIDLADNRIIFRQSSSEFEMATFFEGIDGKEGTFAAIHCNKGLCYQLAKAAGGGYQAIEEVAAKRLLQFAEEWDGGSSANQRLQAFVSLQKACFATKPMAAGEAQSEEEIAANAAIHIATTELANTNGASAALRLFTLLRTLPRRKLYRYELWKDAERAMRTLEAGRAENLREAVARIRQRVSSSGRRLSQRTVSTPLLLKGLEFDHVVIPNAAHFLRESQAQAKLFYVAISRARHTLTVSSPDRYLTFPVPS